MSFARYFRQYHVRRELSMVALSRETGLAKTTLENWQTGRTLPSGSELETLISVLELSSFDQRVLRRAVGLPRAIARLPEGERPPLTGGLLRVMRLRRGLSQSEVARQLSVRQGTLAKWEKSDDWPEADKLSALCALLGATAQEAEAILQGVFLPLPLPINASLEALEERITVLSNRVSQQPNDPLLDLAFLELESQLWLDTNRLATLELLWKIWSFHLSYLSTQHRFKEMHPYADSLLATPCSLSKRSQSYVQSAVIQKAQALRGSEDTWEGQAARRKKSLAFLDAHQGRVKDPECQAWYWMELVGLQIAEQAFDEARICLERSNSIPHPQCVRGTMGESALVTARNLINLGSPREALALLDSSTLGRDDPSFSPLMDLRLYLYRVDALTKLEDIKGALDALTYLCKQIEATGIERMGPRADALFHQLTCLL